MPSLVLVLPVVSEELNTHTFRLVLYSIDLLLFALVHVTFQKKLPAAQLHHPLYSVLWQKKWYRDPCCDKLSRFDSLTYLMFISEPKFLCTCYSSFVKNHKEKLHPRLKYSSSNCYRCMSAMPLMSALCRVRVRLEIKVAVS